MELVPLICTATLIVVATLVFWAMPSARKRPSVRVWGAFIIPPEVVLLALLVVALLLWAIGVGLVHLDTPWLHLGAASIENTGA